MAEKLDAFPTRVTARSPYGSKYARYFDGEIYRLVVGEDIPGLSIKAYLYTLARTQGKRLRVLVEGDALVVQAYSDEDRAA